MQAPAFDDLLDEQLASPQQPVAAGRWNPGPAGAGAAYGFFFALSPDRTGFVGPATSVGVRATFGSAFQRFAYIDAVITAGDPRRAEYENGIPPSEAPSFDCRVRALSEREREALAVMERLGAPLAAAFTADELRRAFRTLALAYHPDRHGDRGAQEQARLGELFTRARDAYETLTGVFARVH